MAVQGFGLFFITGYLKAGSDMYLDGAFVRGAVIGEIAPSNDYGPSVSRLIQ
jgi:hypothetical protein